MLKRAELRIARAQVDSYSPTSSHVEIDHFLFQIFTRNKTKWEGYGNTNNSFNPNFYFIIRKMPATLKGLLD